MRLPVFALALCCAIPCVATQPAPPAAVPAPAASITTLQAISVTGIVPGPGLWKVTRGDHVLWILGVVSTLPAGAHWQSSEVARTLAHTQALLEPPRVKLKVDSSFFGKLFLALPVYRAQRNPDGKTLKDVLPPPLYARWDATRTRYFRDSRKVDRYRPLLAAGKLMQRALKANGLRGDGEVADTVVALAKQHGVARVPTDITVEIKQPHQAVKAFAAQAPDGAACLAAALDVVDHELPVLRARARAWATGDLATLRTLPASAYREACQSALMGAGFAKALGIDNLPARIEARWLAAATAALAAHSQTVAVLPMHDVLDPHGYLAALAARGYTVTPPDAGDDATPAAGSSGTAPAVDPLPAPSTSTAPATH